MDQQVVILRAPMLAPSDSTHAPPTDARPRASAYASPSAAPAEEDVGIQVEVATLDKAQRRDAARDPAIRAVAPVIPTHLIRPVPAADGTDQAPVEPGPTWGVRAVGADRSARTGCGITVAVLDTGIDDRHPAFAGVELVQQDFSGTGNGDRQGHGTHCAGTVFGRDVDGVRIGVAPGVPRALIGKVLADDGGGTSDMLVRGIQWAVQECASVVSMSIGFDFPGMVAQLVEQGWPADLATSAALEGYRANVRMFDALMGVVRAQAGFTSGSLLVAAAGNESRRQLDPTFELAVSIPAAADGVVSVGALARGDAGSSGDTSGHSSGDGGGLTVAPFSNTFPLISAPGVDVLSAEAGTTGLVSLNGTSMATPHVAGVLALWWEEVLDSPVPSLASTVLARAVAAADATAIASGVDVADRGVGLVQAP